MEDGKQKTQIEPRDVTDQYVDLSEDLEKDAFNVQDFMTAENVFNAEELYPDFDIGL